MTMSDSFRSKPTDSCNNNVKLNDLPMYNLANMKDENGVACAPKGGVACPFPWRLHECLEAVEKEGLDHIVSWAPHGRAFTVFQPDKFVELVLPRFFDQTKYPSFQRQLNIYGFSRFLHGRDKGAYYHINFVRGHPSLVRDMVRRKVKGNKHLPKVKKDPYDFYHPAWQRHAEGPAESAAALLSLAEQASNEAAAAVEPTQVEVNDAKHCEKEKKQDKKPLRKNLASASSMNDCASQGKNDDEGQLEALKDNSTCSDPQRFTVWEDSNGQSASDVVTAMHCSDRFSGTQHTSSILVQQDNRHSEPDTVPTVQSIGPGPISMTLRSYPPNFRTFHPSSILEPHPSFPHASNQLQILLSTPLRQQAHNTRIREENQSNLFAHPGYGAFQLKETCSPLSVLSHHDLSLVHRELLLQERYIAALQQQKQAHMASSLQERLAAAVYQSMDPIRQQNQIMRGEMTASAYRGLATAANNSYGGIVNGCRVSSCPIAAPFSVTATRKYF